jgi:hypothetical protein
MRADLYPFQVLLVALARWVSRRQQEVVAYPVEENRVLKRQLGKKRLRLTDDQRRRLAAKGKKLGRQVLNDVATIVPPDTLLRWHRQLIAHGERNHQGIDNRLIERSLSASRGAIECRERLGGLLRFYDRAA